MTVSERKIKANHEHLVKYIDNSFSYAPSPNPPMEKSDTFHYGIKTSLRIFTANANTIITVITAEGISTVTVHSYYDTDKVNTMLDSYNPDAVGEYNNYYRQVK